MSARATADDPTIDRRRAALYVAPFLAVGLFHLVLLLGWGLQPLWAFAILPPMLFVIAVGWVAFRHGFHERGRGDGPADRDGTGTEGEDRSRNGDATVAGGENATAVRDGIGGEDATDR